MPELNERQVLNISPPQKPCTTKPPTNLLARSTITVLMINKKEPKSHKGNREGNEL